eukprot:2878898-Amphidinium_carterae.1
MSVRVGWLLRGPARFAVMDSLSIAVPGFLNLSGFWRWVVNNSITIISAAAASFGLDVFGSKALWADGR